MEDAVTAARADRPECLDGFTRRIRVGCGYLYVTITVLDDGAPFEVFATLGKAGGCPAASVEAVARLASDLFRCGVEVDVPLKTLIGISCHKAMPGGASSGAPLSCFDGIAQTLLMFRDTWQVEYAARAASLRSRDEEARGGDDYSI